jgi:hypothetical protein
MAPALVQLPRGYTLVDMDIWRENILLVSTGPQKVQEVLSAVQQVVLCLWNLYGHIFPLEKCVCDGT